MSAATGSSTKVMTIYIPLLNEGTIVYRPGVAEKIGSDMFRILPTADYDPTVEEWQFPPGSIVHCVKEKKSGREILVAKAMHV